MANTQKSKTYLAIHEMVRNPKRLITDPHGFTKDWEIRYLQIGMVPRQTLLRAVKRAVPTNNYRVVDVALTMLKAEKKIEVATQGGVELYFAIPPELPTASNESAVTERRLNDEWQSLVLLAAVGILRARARREPNWNTTLKRLSDEIEKYRTTVVGRPPC